MRKFCGKLLAGAIASLALVAFAGSAEAGWRWHGSHGGSWGSYGSSGGSWGSSGGSWGSSGGSWGGGHWHHKHWRSHGSWGSSGGYGSSGGGWGSSGGSWGSSGGSSGGWGSSGGSSGGSYYMPMDVKGADPSLPPAAPAPGAAPAAPAPGAPAAPAPGQSTSLRGGDGLLTVSVPDDAKIYVNGQPTTSTGSLRQYVSRDLNPGYNYAYEVRAEVVRDGRTVEQVKKVDLRAGETANVSFDFPAGAAQPETSLTLHVPADAKVYLAGNPTKASGETRVFRTTGLTGGAWDGYTVRVEVERGGRTLTKEETITVKAGESQELRFDFEGDKIASK